jgi:hypothetical protein
MAEAYKELATGLDKLKANMEGMASGSVTSTSLRRMWENKAERICQEDLNQAYKFMEESGPAVKQEGNQGKVSLSSCSQIK